MTEERVQKLIARTGLCSRRDADLMVREGRVTVNGRVAEPGTKADPDSDHIKVDGKMLRRPQALRYLLLYKPREVMTTCDDPEGRKTVVDLVSTHVKERVFPVGRLDYHSEGLLILTNDGDLAARVTHPRYGVVRQYSVKIRGDLSKIEYLKLMRGVVIDGQHVKPQKARRERLNRDGTISWWRVEVTEGRTHEVRELFFRAGHQVQRLKRVAIGPLRDPSLHPGDFRDLTGDEVAALLKAAAKSAAKSSMSRRPPRRDSGPKAASGARGSGRSRGAKPQSKKSTK